MGKTWVLDTETKGTGANVRPLEKVMEKPAAEEEPAPRRRRPARPSEPAPRPRRERPVTKTSTGEIGKVEEVDPRAGTARVRWLKRGASSTVRLSEISRR
jgi:hypothetical protein